MKLHNGIIIDVYSKDGCKYCDILKEWLNENDVEYNFHDLTDDTKRTAFYEKYNVNSVPQVFLDNHLIGGSENFEHYKIPLTRGSLCESIVYKPFKFPKAVELACEHEKMHWIEDEIHMDADVQQWKSKDKLTDYEKKFITNILRLFTQMDVQVAGNYCDQFIPRFKNTEIRNLLTSIAAREAIHQRSYSLLNETLGFTDSFYNEFLEYKELTDKIEYMAECNSKTLYGLALCLARSVFFEGVSLFSSFAMLLFLQKSGKMINMNKVVEFSIRDESLHVKAVAYLFDVILKEYPFIANERFFDKIRKTAKDVHDLECKFVDMAYSFGNLDGLAPEDVKKYIKYITNMRLKQINLEPMFDVHENPLPYLSWIINGSDFTNFFEGVVSQYEVSGLSGNCGYSDSDSD